MNWTLDLIQSIESLPKEHKNIRTLKALENLINNLDKINIEDIENLTYTPVIEPTIYRYEVKVESDKDDIMKVNGWIAISDDMIPDMSKIPQYIKSGLLRKRQYKEPIIGTASKTKVENENRTI